jgi:hypothetical protein
MFLGLYSIYGINNSQKKNLADLRVISLHFEGPFWVKKHRTLQNHSLQAEVGTSDRIQYSDSYRTR